MYLVTTVYLSDTRLLATKKGREKEDMLKVCQAKNELEHIQH